MNYEFLVDSSLYQGFWSSRIRNITHSFWKEAIWKCWTNEKILCLFTRWCIFNSKQYFPGTRRPKLQTDKSFKGYFQFQALFWWWKNWCKIMIWTSIKTIKIATMYCTWVVLSQIWRSCGYLVRFLALLLFQGATKVIFKAFFSDGVHHFFFGECHDVMRLNL